MRDHAEDKEKEEATKPWEPYSKLTISLKDPSWKPRWVSRENLYKALNEGWVIVRPEEVASMAALSLEDGSVIDGKITRGRNLVLCKMRKDMVKSREEYFSKLSKDQLATSQKELKQNKEVYGDLKIEKGE